MQVKYGNYMSGIPSNRTIYHKNLKILREQEGIIRKIANKL